MVKTEIETKSNTTKQKETTVHGKKQMTDAIQLFYAQMTSRAGLVFFTKYLQSIQLMPIMERILASLHK